MALHLVAFNAWIIPTTTSRMYSSLTYQYVEMAFVIVEVMPSAQLDVMELAHHDPDLAQLAMDRLGVWQRQYQSDLTPIFQTSCKHGCPTHCSQWASWPASTTSPPCVPPRCDSLQRMLHSNHPTGTQLPF